MMKKLLTIFVIIMLAITLIGCTQENENKKLEALEQRITELEEREVLNNDKIVEQEATIKALEDYVKELHGYVNNFTADYGSRVFVYEYDQIKDSD